MGEFIAQESIASQFETYLIILINDEHGITSFWLSTTKTVVCVALANQIMTRLNKLPDLNPALFGVEAYTLEDRCFDCFAIRASHGGMPSYIIPPGENSA